MNLSEKPLPPGDPGVLIIGGGLVGASLAIALDAAGIAATLVETAAPRVETQPSHDQRNLALARTSVNGLTAIGVARALARARTASTRWAGRCRHTSWARRCCAGSTTAPG